MGARWHVVRGSAIILALALPSNVASQSHGVKLQLGFDLALDCETPDRLENYPIHARITGTLNTDKSASLDLVTSGLTSTTVHFDAHLGGAPRAAPGGTSQLHVLAGNRLRGTWTLPNNNLIVDIAITERSCSANLNVRLKPGQRQYSIYNGNRFYYCSRVRVSRTSCEAD
jgi:hypothetical protein